MKAKIAIELEDGTLKHSSCIEYGYDARSFENFCTSVETTFTNQIWTLIKAMLREFGEMKAKAIEEANKPLLVAPTVEIPEVMPRIEEPQDLIDEPTDDGRVEDMPQQEVPISTTTAP